MHVYNLYCRIVFNCELRVFPTFTNIFTYIHMRVYYNTVQGQASQLLTLGACVRVTVVVVCVCV